MVEEKSETFEVASCYRPLIRSAREALSDYGIIDVKSGEEAGVENAHDVVIVEERPGRDVLEEHELQLVEDPEEVWEDTAGTTVEIYPDRVIAAGSQSSLSPEEAREKCRTQDYFERVDAC